MRLSHGLHLAYCTNIHRGETWAEIQEALRRHVLAVRDRVSPGRPYAIGLRLSDAASRELVQPAALDAFRQWLAAENCYVFTINGFPFGRFHGTRVKEQVFQPDWSTEARLDYTKRLFDILAAILPDGVEGSVSTVPGSHKELIVSPEQPAAIRRNFWRVIDHVAEVSARMGKTLHLGLEPEPLGWVENTEETLQFFADMAAERPGEVEKLQRHLGVNYDTCHFAVEYEDAMESLDCFHAAGIRISKLHLSSALKVKPGAESVAALGAFAEDTYFHQTLARLASGDLKRFRDLPVALAEAAKGGVVGEEWRVHFHVPLHAAPTAVFDTTADHLRDALDWLAMHPDSCSHLEMETYTWEVMPSDLKNRSVVDQLVEEYGWTLAALKERGFGLAG
jgi:sugar phosphate isomerase/epimerase